MAPAPVLSEPVLPALQEGEAIDVLIPVTGEVTDCTTDHPLPAGVRLERSAGGCRLVGTPQQDLPQQTITIIATNASGSHAQSVELYIAPRQPQLSTVGAITITLGESVNLVFSNSGGRLDTCSRARLAQWFGGACQQWPVCGQWCTWQCCTNTVVSSYGE